MSSSDRRFLLKALALAPVAAAAAGCGFSPAYAPGGAGAALLNGVSLPEPDTEDSYLLIRALEERIGREAAPRYELALELEVTEDRLAVTEDNITTRFNVLGRLRYTLTETASGLAVGSNELTNFTGYSSSGTPVATTAAQRAAHERLMTILADMLVARLMGDVAHAVPVVPPALSPAAPSGA